jgi:hypothetical protein
MGVARDRDSGRDRLVLTSPSRFYLSRPRFSGQRQLEQTAAALVAASRENPNGARAFAHAGRRHSLAGWWEYEERLTPILAETGVTCLCVYDRTGWETESWRMAADLHPYVVRDGVVSRGGAPAA